MSRVASFVATPRLQLTTVALSTLGSGVVNCRPSSHVVIAAALCPGAGRKSALSPWIRT
jgi:hypothetical protein